MSTAAAAVLATVETRAKQHHTADPPRRGPSGSTITAARGLSKALKRMETAGAGRRLIFGARPLAGSAGDDYLFRAVVMTGIPVRSPTYDLFERAMRRRRQILCVYDGYPRELCPIVLGHRRGQEVALTYQFAGKSSGRLPPGGQWKCLRLSKVSEVRLRDGPWRAGDRHLQRQTCVEVVDFDVNPESPYVPRRR